MQYISNEVGLKLYHVWNQNPMCKLMKSGTAMPKSSMAVHEQKGLRLQMLELGTAVPPGSEQICSTQARPCQNQAWPCHLMLIPLEIFYFMHWKSILQHWFLYQKLQFTNNFWLFIKGLLKQFFSWKQFLLNKTGKFFFMEGVP